MSNGHSTGNSLRNKINTRIQEGFRDSELEYQLIAYLARVQPAACGMVRREWLSDGTLQDVFDILDDTRATYTKASLTQEMKKAGLVSEPDLVDECLSDVFDSDVGEIEDRGAQKIIEQVMELYDSRRVLLECGNIISKMKTFNLQTAKRKLKELGAPIQIVHGDDEGFYIDDYYKRVEIMKEREKAIGDDEDGSVGIPTGIYRFDKMCGGILPGEFGVIGGIPGVGKTAGIINFGIHAWLSGYNAVIVTGEMPNSDMQFRIDAHLSKVSGMKFRKAELDESDYTRWDNTIKRYTITNSDNVLYTASLTRDFTIDQVESIIIRIQNDTGKKIQWLGLDYLNIMSSASSRNGNSNKDWTSQADVVWDVKRLTQEYKLVTWTGNQIIDDAFEKDVYEISDLKYARAIGETAPVVVAFIRTDRDIMQKRMRLQVMKMRNAVGEVPMIILHPNLDTMVIDVGMHSGKKNILDLDKETFTKTRKKVHKAPIKRVKEN